MPSPALCPAPCPADASPAPPVQFVYPRVNPVRKDVAVMTNQAEIVNIWED